MIPAPVYTTVDSAQVGFLIAIRYHDGSSVQFPFCLERFSVVCSWQELSLCVVCGFLSRSDKGYF